MIRNNSECLLPLVVAGGEVGWKMIKIDMSNLISKAFGTEFVACHEIQFQGSVRLAKIYFEDKDYAEIQLPSFLRVLTEKTYTATNA
jgi:hypothetical protein